MKVIVDTCVWSEVLRRKRGTFVPGKAANELAGLINDFRVVMMGVIRQELLSGVSEKSSFSRLKEYLHPFPDLVIQSDDHIRAAEMFNICRKKGVQGSHTDFLICAAAEKHSCEIFTSDKDFLSYSKILPIELYNK